MRLRRPDSNSVAKTRSLWFVLAVPAASAKQIRALGNYIGRDEEFPETRKHFTQHVKIVCSVILHEFLLPETSLIAGTSKKHEQ